MGLLDFLASPSFPPLARFALGMAILVGVPLLCRRVRLPAVVGLLASGVVVGPHVLGIFGEDRPVADFFGQLGQLLLMFFAGLEIDLSLLRRAQMRSITFGTATTLAPLVLGTCVGLAFGYALLSAIVLGSLLASHTLLGAPIVARLGARRLEAMIVTTGATVLSDTLTLVVFAVAVSTFETGFSVARLAVQLTEIAIFVPLILVGLSRVGAWVLERVREEEDAEVVAMLGVMAVAAVLAQASNLPGIVGAFLAGLAVNTATRDRAAREKLELIGNALFVPAFFAVTGFLIDPAAFARSIVENFPLIVALLLALLVGKGIAAEGVGRAFRYDGATRATMWSLTIPQVGATLAATLVAFHTVDPGGARLIDRHLLNAILVLVVITAVAGPLLTQRLASAMVAGDDTSSSSGGASFVAPT